MPTVKFTRHLKRYFPELDALEVDGETVLDVVLAVDAIHPGFAFYVVDEQKRLRKHVNVFIGDVMVKDRETLSDTVTTSDEIYIMQALSGG